MCVCVCVCGGEGGRPPPPRPGSLRPRDPAEGGGQLIPLNPDVWEMLTDNSYLSAILDRQELLVATPKDLRTKKAEQFTPQYCRAFGTNSRKNPKIVVMSPIVATKSYKQQEVIWQQYHVCLAVAEHQILGGKHFLIPRKNLVVEEGTIPEKNTTTNGLSCTENTPSGCFTILAICHLESTTASRE